MQIDIVELASRGTLVGSPPILQAPESPWDVKNEVSRRSRSRISSPGAHAVALESTEGSVLRTGSDP